jgi:cytochrome c553
MKKKLLALSISLASALTPNVLHAEANSNAGKEKAAACAGCHGEDGNSMVSTFPKLAQQHSSYLIKELKAFKAGTRVNAMMNPLAMGLSDEDIEDIAAFYTSKKISANTLPTLEVNEDDQAEADPSKTAESDINQLIAEGSDLYRNGDIKREVSACIACHGPFGEGNKPAAFPAIKSQHADYLIKTLNDFKSGQRSNNPDNMMHMIAKKMTEKEIKSVSYYISMMKP